MAEGGTRLVIPALAPLYNCTAHLTNPLLRLAFAAVVFPAGLAKFLHPDLAASVVLSVRDENRSAPRIEV